MKGRPIHVSGALPPAAAYDGPMRYWNGLPSRCRHLVALLCATLAALLFGGTALVAAEPQQTPVQSAALNAHVSKIRGLMDKIEMKLTSVERIIAELKSLGEARAGEPERTRRQRAAATRKLDSEKSAMAEHHSAGDRLVAQLKAMPLRPQDEPMRRQTLTAWEAVSERYLKVDPRTDGGRSGGTG